MLRMRLVRAFSPDDIAFATHLASREGWEISAGDYRNLISFEPQGCFIAEDAGEPVGLITTIAYGKLGWIGSLIVDDTHRGQGYGRTLLETGIGYLLDNGVRTVGVDATPAGAFLYESAGFWHAFDTLHWRRPALPAPAPLPDSLVPFGPSQLHEVTMFDWAPFGGRRRRVLRAQLGLSPVAHIVQDQDGIGGYLLARRGNSHWIIGPWVCVRSAEALLTAALADIGQEPVDLAVPQVNEDALQLLPRYGFEIQSHEQRMYLGDEEGIGRPQRIYATAGPEKA